MDLPLVDKCTTRWESCYEKFGNDYKLLPFIENIYVFSSRTEEWSKQPGLSLRCLGSTWYFTEDLRHAVLQQILIAENHLETLTKIVGEDPELPSYVYPKVEFFNGGVEGNIVTVSGAVVVDSIFTHILHEMNTLFRAWRERRRQ